MDEEQPALRWSGEEYAHVQRGSDWYWALGIASVCIALISFLLGNALFSVLVLIAAFTIALLARTPPPTVTFEISERGIQVGNTIHRYDEVLSFWVEDHDTDQPTLLLEVSRWGTPHISIPLDETIEPNYVRAFLAEYADEKPIRESRAHKFLEILGL